MKKITDIKEAEKSSRFNVFTEEGYAFSLSAKGIFECEIAVGKVFSEAEFENILHYVEGTATLPPQEELESILERLMKRMLDDRADMSAKPTEKIDSSGPFSADDLATIAGTLQAFRR